MRPSVTSVDEWPDDNYSLRVDQRLRHMFCIHGWLWRRIRVHFNEISIKYSLFYVNIYYRSYWRNKTHDSECGDERNIRTMLTLSSSNPNDDAYVRTFFLAFIFVLFFFVSLRRTDGHIRGDSEMEKGVHLYGYICWRVVTFAAITIESWVRQLC